MTDDHDALLAAILANREEDTPRLVYADWLEENGKAEWGEFIRTQIEIAKTPHTHAAPQDDRKSRGCRRCKLRRMEKLLWEKCGTAMSVPFFLVATGRKEMDRWAFLTTLGKSNIGAAQGNSCDFRFSRGFVSHLRCCWSDWRTNHVSILKSNPIETIELEDSPPGIPVRRGDGTYTAFIDWKMFDRPELPGGFTASTPHDAVIGWLKTIWPSLTFQIRKWLG